MIYWRRFCVKSGDIRGWWSPTGSVDAMPSGRSRLETTCWCPGKFASKIVSARHWRQENYLWPTSTGMYAGCWSWSWKRPVLKDIPIPNSLIWKHMLRLPVKLLPKEWFCWKMMEKRYRWPLMCVILPFLEILLTSLLPEVPVAVMSKKLILSLWKKDWPEPVLSSIRAWNSIIWIISGLKRLKSIGRNTTTSLLPVSWNVL